MNDHDQKALLPLEPVWFHVLLTLAEQPVHGYAIRKTVEERTGGLDPAVADDALRRAFAPRRRGLIVGEEGGDDASCRRFGHFHRTHVSPNFARRIALAEAWIVSVAGSKDVHGKDLSRRELLARAGALAAAVAVPDMAGLDGGGRAGVLPDQEAFPRKADFDIPDGVTYLNGAYMHPMPRTVRQAVREYNDRRAGFTTRTSDDPDISRTVKAEFARLINAKATEISSIPNTSTGEVLVVHGLGIPGTAGNVVTDALHFEGAIVHLQWLERDAGLDLRIVMPRDGRIDLADLERVIDRDTRLVELSSVAMYNGFQHDLEAVCDLAHAHGAYVYADIIQGAGAVPIDVRATGLDFAACSGFKWLMGDLGLGFLYVREELIGEVMRRTQAGYHSVGRYATHFLPYDTPGPSPFSWEFGTSASAHAEVGSVAGAARAALATSIPYLRTLDVARIAAHRQPLLRRLRDELPRLGFECVTPEGTTSPIISFTMADGRSAQERLARAGVDVRITEHYVRFSPSVYNDMADVERVLEALS